jgi:hypothetical protein
VLSVKIYDIKNVKIYDGDKIICVSVMWVRSVDVLCAVSPSMLGGAVVCADTIALP